MDGSMVHKRLDTLEAQQMELPIIPTDEKSFRWAMNGTSPPYILR